MASSNHQSVEKSSRAADVPLCVDLDGTLLLNDSLAEQAMWTLFHRPWQLVKALVVLVSEGKAAAKAAIADAFDSAALPGVYNAAVCEAIRSERLAGRRVILVTATNGRIAQRFADDTKLFDGTIASDAQVNLRGSAKAARLVAEFGKGGFDYAGNDRTDLRVWEVARAAWVVNDREDFVKQVAALAPVDRVFRGHRWEWSAAIRSLRPHQWAKNLLLFVPMMMAHLWASPAAWTSVLMAFAAFSAAASAVYLLNDLVDVHADRKHPTKHARPIASGRVGPVPALVLATVLVGAAVGLACLCPASGVLITLAVYLALTTAYSFLLKRVELIDVFVLALLYMLRLIAGGRATGVVVSSWLLAFSLFLFLSLALVKRFCEADQQNKKGGTGMPGRGYDAGDAEFISSLGSASGYMAVLVLALYINSPEVLHNYRHPQLLWVECLIMLYWISRIWLLTHRRRMHDDPVFFAIKDVQSYVCGVLALATLAAAILL